MRTIASLALLTGLAGCATPAPRVTYRPLSDHTGPTGIPYQLTATRILFVPKPDKADDKPDLKPVTLYCEAQGCFDAAAGGKPIAIAVVAVPIASATRPILAIRPHSRRLVTTALAPTYFSDSLRLKVLTVEATDHLDEAIKTVGAIAVGAKGLFGAGNATESGASVRQKLTLPLSYDPELQPDSKEPAKVALVLQDKWRAYEEHPDDQVDPGAQGFLAYPARPDGSFALPPIGDAILSSACRPASIVLAWDKGAIAFHFSLTIADPAWLMAMPFPPKGSMTFHTLCGIDVQSEPVTRVSTDQVAEDFFAAARQVTTP